MFKKHFSSSTGRLYLQAAMEIPDIALNRVARVELPQVEATTLLRLVTQHIKGGGIPFEKKTSWRSKSCHAVLFTRS